jgi:hypothetical protein
MRVQLSLVLGSLFLATAAPGPVVAGNPPPVSVSFVFFGQPNRALEVSGNPLGRTLAVFRSSRAGARLPRPAHLMQPLAFVAKHMRGEPGALVLERTRRVTTPAGALYLVPTVRGWLCVQGPRFETCHRGLLKEGVTWTYSSSTPSGVDVFGIAADDVRGVSLAWQNRHRRAQLADNVFFVHRPLRLTSSHVPKLGDLTISYRDGRQPTNVPLN